jgi:hypothetical protein
MNKTLQILMAGLMTGLLLACPSQKALKDGPVKVELLDEFVITAFWGPPPQAQNLENYRKIKLAGIDVLFPGNGIMNGEDNLKALDLAEQAGIRVIPFDTRLLRYARSPDPDIDTSVLDAMIVDYKDHPALAGYVVRDEPAASMFPKLRDICQLIRERDPGHEPFINLFPSYAGPERLGSADFRSHIREFIDAVSPGVLSYDYYALREPDTWYDGWFSDLDIVRDETRKAGIPFWIFIQSEGIRGGLRVPTRAEILWQANTAVAYGARGLGWFTYWTPEVNPDDPHAEQHYNAMVSVDGHPTEMYDYVREANLFIKPVGKGLMGWDNRFVARYEEGQLHEGGSAPVISPGGPDAHLIIGTYVRGDRCRVLIANSRCDKATSFSLVLSPDWQWVGLVSSIEARQEDDENPQGEWTLGPGGAIVSELKQKTR